MTTRSYARATVIGAQGFIGGYIAKDLQRRGLEVITPRRLSDWEEVDAGLLVWAAGYTSDYGRDPRATIAAHAGDLAEALQTKCMQGLVYLSSARLYDGLEGTVSEDSPLGLDPAVPRHLFDLSKGLGEWLVRNCDHPNATVLRLSGVYSDRLDGGSFLEDVIARAFEGWSGELDTAPDVLRDYVHVTDVCEAVWAAATRGSEPLYIVGSGECVDNQTLLGILSERTGTQIRPVAPATGSRVPTLDVSRIHGLGVKPRSLTEGLDRVLTFQDNQRAMQSMMGVTQMPWM